MARNQSVALDLEPAEREVEAPSTASNELLDTLMRKTEQRGGVDPR
jgi:hypothetical protein